MQPLPLFSWISSINEPLIIAGPCGAESHEQLMKTAKGLKALNKVSLFRAGVWKPRTRPDSFEGIGEEALLWLKDVKREFGFKTTVEVASAGHAELAMKHGVDVLWIGARTTVNPFTVQEIAGALKGTKMPLLVKNPVHPDLQLWIGALERFYNSGINQIAAVHRGFHYQGSSKYRNKPLWQIPIELKTMFPGMPVICDPSHISGNRNLILQVAQEALDLGMEGLMIESHFNPDQALSDAKQQLTPDALSELLSGLVLRKGDCADISCMNRLSELRKIVDEVDEELLSLLKKRIELVEQIGHYKKEHNITIFQLERWQEILRTRGQWADKLAVSREFVEKICQLLHEESIRVQNNLMNK
jgi:chorismate mutase